MRKEDWDDDKDAEDETPKAEGFTSFSESRIKEVVALGDFWDFVSSYKCLKNLKGTNTNHKK